MPHEFPLVSIVLPTYNGARYIGQSIDSCLGQTYPNIELIVVDDGSRDDTQEILQSYKDKRMTVLTHTVNKGLPVALNTGFTAAAGAYLTWTSDDNRYAPEAVETMIDFAAGTQAPFVYCSYYRFEEEDQENQVLVYLPNRLTLEKSNRVGPCFLYTRQVMETVGAYDPETFLAEDYDYWIRVSRQFPMRRLDKPLYYFRRHKASLFNTRYYEVRAVDYLVRLKNSLLEVPQVTELYLGLFRERFGEIRTLFGLLPRWRYGNRIRSTLTRYREGKLTFTEARTRLTKLVENNRK